MCLIGIQLFYFKPNQFELEKYGLSLNRDRMHLVIYVDNCPQVSCAMPCAYTSNTAQGQWKELKAMSTKYVNYPRQQIMPRLLWTKKSQLLFARQFGQHQHNKNREK